jgi:heme-degrading monooxygenase HmoA
VIAVLFEVQPLPGRAHRYFEIAASLREELHATEGFVSVERFESLSRPGHYLSLSVWRDEESARRWRCAGHHRDAQREGRGSVFADYRIRVVQVVRDYGMVDRAQVPEDSLHALV